jgi:hypothetical protein
MESYYANLVAYRVSAKEFVLEFGNFFTGQENRNLADFEDFDLRVVMLPDLIEPLIQMLQQATIARDLQRNTLVEKPPETPPNK